MKRIKSVLRSSMAKERMYNLALLNTEQDIVHKMDFTDIIDLFTAAETRIRLFLVFFKDLQSLISFSSISVPKILLLSVQFEKKIFLFQFLRLLHFQMSHMNTKLRFQVGPEALISPVRQGPCGLNPALLGEIPPSVEFSP